MNGNPESKVQLCDLELLFILQEGGRVSKIEFTKLEGLGNDFLIVKVEDVSLLQSARELAQQMCDRNFGAGADGLIFVTRARHKDADFASRTFNSDGSEAGVSGNGTRC